MTALLLALAVAQTPADALDGEAAFEVVDARGEATVSRRAVKGSPFFSWRVEGPSAHPVDALCVAIFEWGTKEADAPGLLVNRVLQDGDDERVIYNQMSQPVVSNRDYALRLKRERLTDGSCRVRFATANEEAPPAPPGTVRMERLFGEWLMTPRPEGGARLRYTLFSDPAGAVPAFLVHGPAKKATVESFEKALEKTRRHAEGGR